MILGIFTFCDVINSARILLHATQQVSHVQEQVHVGETLVDRGHEVYALLDSKYPQVSAIENAGVIPIFYHEPDGAETFLTYHAKTSDTVFSGKSLDLHPMLNLLNDVCLRMFENKELIQKLKDIKFDLVIVDAFMLQMCNYVLPVILDVPHVYIFSGIIDLAVGVPSLPSFTPATFTQSPDHMTFVERLKNIFANCFMYYALHLSDNKSLFGKYTHGKSLQNIMSESELFIITRDHVLEWPAVTLPNVLRVPGLTIRQAQDLPSHLQKTISSAKYIAVVSFGSSVDTFPVDVMEKFLDAFSRHPQVTFMFRVSKGLTASLNNVPSNVMLLPWLPQQDILGHDKTVLFITHCGNNGQYESVYHGVPMIGFPMFAEQDHNCFRMSDKTLGVCMKILSFTADELSANIKLILSDGRFRASAEKRSGILKSMGNPTQLIADKLEDVLEFGGDHLRSASLDMPLYQLLMLDIIAIVGLVLLIVLVFIIFLIRFLLRKCFGKKPENKGKQD